MAVFIPKELVGSSESNNRPTDRPFIDSRDSVDVSITEEFPVCTIPSARSFGKDFVDCDVSAINFQNGELVFCKD